MAASVRVATWWGRRTCAGPVVAPFLALALGAGVMSLFALTFYFCAGAARALTALPEVTRPRIHLPIRRGFQMLDGTPGGGQWNPAVVWPHPSGRRGHLGGLLPSGPAPGLAHGLAPRPIAGWPVVGPGHRLAVVAIALLACSCDPEHSRSRARPRDDRLRMGTLVTPLATVTLNAGHHLPIQRE